VPFRAGADGVSAPDEPRARPVLWRIRVVDGELDVAGLEPIHHEPHDLLVARRPGLTGLLGQLQRVLLELREERQPAAAHGPSLVIDRVVPSRAGLWEGVVIREASLVAPLIGMHVVERWRVLVTWRHHPIQTERNGSPGGLVDDLLLPDVMTKTSAVGADRAG
jgi:hypothetical protein